MVEPRRRPGSPRRMAAALLLAALAAACATRPEPELLRRFRSHSVADTSGLVDVTLFAGPARVPGTRLTDLSASAQTALIRELGDKTDSPEALLRALSGPLARGFESAPGGDHGIRFRRRVVVSAENRGAGGGPGRGGADRLHPDARIDRLRVAVGLDTAVAAFRSWDRFATRYETVDLGEMEFSGAPGRDGALAVSPGPLLRELELLELGSGRSATLEESLPLRQRYVSTGMLRPDSVILLQQGAVGLDLTGNTVVELEIAVKPAPTPWRVLALEGLFDAGGRPRPPDAVRVLPRDVAFAPSADGGVRGRLSYRAVTRMAGPGPAAATWAEGDDDARLLVEVGPSREVVLIAEEELRTTVWQLATPGCRRILQIDNPRTGRPGPVSLASPGEATDLLRWLRATSASRVGGRALHLGSGGGGNVLLDADGLRLRLVPVNWDPGGGTPCP